MVRLSSLTAVLAALAAVEARPTESPVQIMNRSPSPGVVITKCVKPGVLALAFDDGPYTFTQALVDRLNNAGAKGTFFFTGTLYGCIYNYAKAVKNAYDTGHQISSHTWTHAALGPASSAKIIEEMTKLEQAFVNIFGRKPTYMRPPNLSTSQSMLNQMRTMGYKVITDDIDSGDWNKQTAAQSQARFTQAGAGGNGHIPLMHETYDSTVNQLVPWLLDWAEKNNLKLVTVAECLDDTEGPYVPGNFTGNGVSRC